MLVRRYTARDKGRMGVTADEAESDESQSDESQSDGTHTGETDSDRAQRADGAASSVAVELRGVTKRFGDVMAVDAVDLAIAEGEFFSLLGPSGCGKTTTLRMIAGLEFPTEGSLRIRGEEMGIRPPNKRPVNTVFQSYALFPHLTVSDNVAFGLTMQKVDKAERRQRVNDSLALVQLGEYGERKPDELSGGQQQRVALARALINRPEVLLLDEPLGALDQKLRKGMQFELKALQQEVGITFVYVTHDQEEALTMSDRIGVMGDGKLLQVGSAEDIYERPETRFVADFIGETNLLDATVEGSDLVCLTNGDRLSTPTDLPVGEGVAMSIRPERVTVHQRGGAPEGRSTLDGTVAASVYLGNALVYEIDVDWITIESRVESIGGEAEFAAGDDVTVSWPSDAARVVVGR